MPIRYFLRLLILLSLFICTSGPAFAQSTSSTGSWTILGLKWPFAPKWQLAYDHIFIRQNDFYAEHNRHFADFKLAYQHNSKVSFLLLNRFIPVPGEANNAFWIFIDANYLVKKSNKKWSLKNRIRMHLGTEAIGELNQADFIRYAAFFYYPVKKWTPFFSFEPFFQLNGLNELQRIRWEIGTNYKFNDRWGMTAYYR
ncbi:MAG: DUF2490 domain-containing protein, partial [Bacteroidota bacterium]